MGWTKSQRNSIRSLYGKVPVAKIAAVTGKNPGAVVMMARQLGLQAKRQPWTDEQIETVRLRYGDWPLRRIAEAVGKSAPSVCVMAKRLGLPGLRFVPDQPFLDRLRSLHAEGLSDKDMGSALGKPRDTIRRLRREIGLPPNNENERHRARKSASATRRRQRDPHCWGGSLRSAAIRRFAERSGWPADLPARAIQALNILAAVGIPLTHREICDAAGVRLTNTSGGIRDDLLLLVRRGLAVQAPRGRRQQKGGKTQVVPTYSLGVAALNLLERRAQCAPTGNAT